MSGRLCGDVIVAALLMPAESRSRECTAQTQGRESLCDIADWKCDKAVIEGVEMSKFDRQDFEVTILDVRADQSFNRRPVVSRQFKLRAVIEYNGIFSLVLWAKFLDSFSIHQGRAVNSHKSG